MCALKLKEKEALAKDTKILETTLIGVEELLGDEIKLATNP